VSRRKGRRVVAASRVHARGSRKILLTRRVARQDRLQSVRSSRLLLFAQQMVRHELLRFSYCIAVGGTPTNCAPSLVEQRGALERTAFSACQRLGECLCDSARGCTVPGVGINGRIRREAVVPMFQAMGSHRPRADGGALEGGRCSQPPATRKPPFDFQQCYSCLTGSFAGGAASVCGMGSVGNRPQAACRSGNSTQF
jgi:hypothetical protein